MATVSLALLPPRPVHAAGQAGGSLAARYALDVTVDDQQHTIGAREAVQVTNRTGITLKALVFSVTARHTGGFVLGPVTVNGTAEQPRLGEVAMAVALPAPLAPEASVQILMDFHAVVPVPGDLRYGYSQGVLVLGDWFPILAADQTDGWSRQSYSAIGNPPFTDVADYQVTLHGDPHLVIAHTGVESSHHGGTWVFAAHDVRGFALSLSRSYQSQSVRVDGTRLTSYFLAGDRAGGVDALEYAKESFDWYSQHIGPYGYPSFEVAEIPSQVPTAAGEQFPNLIVVASPQERQPHAPGQVLTYLVALETGHQWFSDLVGSDPVRQPWLGEGLPVQLSYLFLKERYPSEYFSAWSRLQAEDQQATERWGRKPLDSAVTDYASRQEYTASLDPAAALFLERLRATMGSEAYFSFLKDYVATYRGQIATTADFLLMAEQYAGRDLTDLYREYFGPGSYSPVTPTAEASPKPTATVPPTPTVRPSPTATLATPTPSPIATLRSAGPTPVRVTTPEATPSPSSGSAFLATTAQLILLSSGLGLALIALLSILLIRRS